MQLDYNFKDIHYHMDLAREEAEKAFKQNEVPVGAILIDHAGKIIARAHNEKEYNSKSHHHAELLALERGSEELGDWRLNQCTLFVTLEPCIMCMGALQQYRIKHLVFGAYDRKGGAISLGYHVFKDSRLNHNFSVMGGVQHYRCSKLLSDFFKTKRSFY